MCRIITVVRSNPICSEPRLHRCAKALAETGEKVRVLVWNRGNIASFNAKEFRTPYEVLQVKLRAPSGGFYVIPFLPIWMMYQFVYHLISPAKIIHACDLDTLIPALLANIIRKKKIVYDVYDLYAERQPPAPQKLRKLVTWFEKFLMRFADIVILADESRYEQIRGTKLQKSLVIYNSPEDIIQSIEDSNFKECRKTFRIFYAGKIGIGRGIEDIIKAIEGMDDVEFLIAGFEGLHMKSIMRLIDRSINVRYLGAITHEEVIKLTLSADMLFALYDPSIPMNKYASPNKLFEAMLCGKPIVVSSGTSMAKIVEKEKCGLVVPYGDIGRLRCAINLLKNNPEFAKRLGMNGRRAYQKKYSWRIMKQRLIEAYSSL